MSDFATTLREMLEKATPDTYPKGLPHFLANRAEAILALVEAAQRYDNGTGTGTDVIKALRALNGDDHAS